MKKKHRSLIYLILTCSLIYNLEILSQQKSSNTQTPLKSTSSSLWVTSYYALWSLYNYPPSKIDYTSLTHIIVFSYNPDPSTYPYFSGVTNTVFTTGHNDSTWWHIYGTEDTLIARAHANSVKVLMCLGGIWGTGASNMAWIAADSNRTQAFANSALAYARRHGYNGVDLDWEQYIVKADYSRFLRIFRRGLNTWNPVGLFSTAAGYTPGSQYDITQFAANLDQVNIMTYDYNQGNRTWFNSPLRLNTALYPDFTIANGWTIADHGPTQWIAAGFPKEKLAIALPFYTSLNIGNDAPNQTTVANRVFRNYNDYLQAQAANPSAVHGWDDSAKCSWMGYTSGGTKYFWSYDDSAAFYWKIKLAKDLGLGGIMLYSIGDGFVLSTQKNPLLDAVRKILGLTNPLPIPKARIRGEIFFDKNRNGQKDANEQTMPGWDIRLQGTKISRDFSDSSGKFSFDSLSIGSYTVSAVVKPSWQQTRPTSQSYSVLINTNETDTVCNFGYYAKDVIGVDINSGWNIISLPLEISEPHTSILFPNATSSTFRYGGGLVATDSLINGPGYFIKFSQSQEMLLAGKIVTRDSVLLNAGWNLIGSISYPVPSNKISTVPSDIISSAFWSLKNSYTASDTIQPGVGYWVKISGAGIAILDTQSKTAKNKEMENLFFSVDSMNSIAFNAISGQIQKLYFTSNPSDDAANAASKYELPPFFKDFGHFDVRFLSTGTVGSIAAITKALGNYSQEIPISIHSDEYPIMMHWNLRPDDPMVYELKSPDGSIVELSTNDSSIIQNSGDSDTQVYKLIFSPKNNSIEPLSFGLTQNYPNPFNGSTQINFTLPSDGYARLVVYDILGRVLSTLIDSQIKKGSHTFPFRPSEKFSSGIYIYRLTYTTNGNTSVKTQRMLYLK